MEKTWQELQQEGFTARESEGDLLKALSLLSKAYSLCDYPLGKVGLKADIALCRRHLGELDLAKRLFASALEDYILYGDVVNAARVRAQLSAIALTENRVDDAYELAFRARSAVTESKIFPNDLCHLTHQLIKVLLKKRKLEGKKNWAKNTREIVSWLKIEENEIKEMMKKEKDPVSANVWRSGYWADVAFLLPPFTYPAGIVGIVIAKQHKLGLRLDQVKNLVK